MRNIIIIIVGLIVGFIFPFYDFIKNEFLIKNFIIILVIGFVLYISIIFNRRKESK